MTKQDWIEKEVELKRQQMPLDAHNKSTYRRMLEKEWEWWEGEEARTLKDSNRYQDDN